MNKLKTTKDLMDIFQVTRKTLYNWRNEGMPFIKVGTTVRFNLDDINKWITNRDNLRK